METANWGDLKEVFDQCSLKKDHSDLDPGRVHPPPPRHLFKGTVYVLLMIFILDTYWLRNCIPLIFPRTPPKSEDDGFNSRNKINETKLKVNNQQI